MNLAVAVYSITDLFQSFKTDREALDGKTIVSGGTLIDGEPPALWLTEELAVKHWHGAMLSALMTTDTKDKTLIWVEPPKVEKFEITIADAKRTHRLAQDRFIVMSKHVIAD